MKTNIGKKFFKFIIRHFSKHHKNKIKLSSYCRNVVSFIASHNRRVIQPTSNNHGCNCRNTAKCPPDDKCLMTKIVHGTMVLVPSKPHISVLIFLNTCGYRKIKKITPNIKWNIMSIVHEFRRGGVCKLCLTKKFWLLKHCNHKHQNKK